MTAGVQKVRMNALPNSEDSLLDAFKMNDPTSSFAPWILYIKENAFRVFQGERNAASGTRDSLDPLQSTLNYEVASSIISGLNESTPSLAGKVNHGIKSYDHKSKSYISPNMLLPSSTSDKHDNQFWTENGQDDDRPTLKSFSLHPVGLNHVECAECHRVVVYSNPTGNSNLINLDKGCKFCATPSFMKLMKIPSNVEMINLNLLVLDVLKEWSEDAKSYPCLHMGFAEHSKLTSETNQADGSSKDSSKEDVNFNPFSFNDSSNVPANNNRDAHVEEPSSSFGPASSTISSVERQGNDGLASNTMDIQSRVALKPVFTVLQGPYLYLFDLKRQSGKLKYKNISGFPVDLSACRIEEDEFSDQIINFSAVDEGSPFRLSFPTPETRQMWEKIFQETLRAHGQVLHHSSVHLLASEVNIRAAGNDNGMHNLRYRRRSSVQNRRASSDQHNSNYDDLIGFYSSDELNQQEEPGEENEKEEDENQSNNNSSNSNQILAESEDVLDTDDRCLTLLVKIVPFHAMPVFDQFLWKKYRMNVTNKRSDRGAFGDGTDDTRAMVQYRERLETSKKLIKSLETFLSAASRSEKKKQSTATGTTETSIRSFELICNEAFPFLNISVAEKNAATNE